MKLLIARLAGVPEGTAGLPTTEDVLERWAQADPNIALISRFLELRGRRAAAQQEDADLDYVAIRNEVHEAQTEELYRELQGLRERNDKLAAATGACYLCWGSDDECVNCTGKGRSGWAPPDQVLFDEIVKPAAARLAAVPPGAASNGNIRSTQQEEIV